MTDLATFNTLDFTVSGIIVLSTLFAIGRGFIGSFLSLVGWVSSIYLAYYMFPEARPLIESKIKNPLVVLVVGHTLLLLIFLIMFGIFNLFATTAVAAMSKGMLDRSLGMVFGVIRGAIIVSFFFLILSMSISVLYGNDDKSGLGEDEIMPSWAKNAKTYGYLKFGRSTVAEFIPDTFYARLKEVYEDISNKSSEQRMLEVLTDRLTSKLPPDLQQSLVEQNEDSVLMSQEDLEIKRAKDVIEVYRQMQANEDDVSGTSSADVNQLEKLVTKRSAVAPKDKKVGG